MKEVIQRRPDETGVTMSAPGSPNLQAGEYGNLIASAHRRCDPRVVRPQRLGPRP
jgi:hypothetical protein